jgi:DNA modification methylase
MSLLLHGDCLEQMKELDNDSVDFIFCDLPYGQTSCKWDIIIPWEPFWNEIMRIKKINTPIFFTTTTKFGVELINNAPKKCPFRYDLVWVKSAPAGFLSAKKMPMRKHEMVYVFYEKLPFYDLSSHKHKFLKREIKEEPTNKKENDLYGIESGNAGRKKGFHQTSYDHPLPVSVVKEATMGECYGNDERNLEQYKDCGKKGKNQVLYDPPLPVSVVKEPEPEEGPLPTTMLEIKSTRGKHSTEKPVALMEWLLKYYSKEGDVVLDPTMGSGSTGVACKNMNRNFIGIEKDDKIFEIAFNRLN